MSSKPKLAIAPRKPVDELAARQLEEALERRSDGIAGASQSNLAPGLPKDVQSKVTESGPPRSRRSEIAPKGKTTSATSSPTPSLPNTGLGTRANPRERKSDGVKTRSTSIHLPIDLGLRLTMYCARNGRRQSEIVALAVEKWLDAAE